MEKPTGKCPELSLSAIIFSTAGYCNSRRAICTQWVRVAKCVRMRARSSGPVPVVATRGEGRSGVEPLGTAVPANARRSTPRNSTSSGSRPRLRSTGRLCQCSRQAWCRSGAAALKRTSIAEHRWSPISTFPVLEACTWSRALVNSGILYVSGSQMNPRASDCRSPLP